MVLIAVSTRSIDLSFALISTRRRASNSLAFRSLWIARRGRASDFLPSHSFEDVKTVVDQIAVLTARPDRGNDAVEDLLAVPAGAQNYQGLHSPPRDNIVRCAALHEESDGVVDLCSSALELVDDGNGCIHDSAVLVPQQWDDRLPDLGTSVRLFPSDRREDTA